jgi:hypothetical protein
MPIIYGIKFEIYGEKLKRQIQHEYCHKNTNVTIHMLICLFCYSMYILNLVLKIIEIADTYLVNTHVFSIFFETCKFEISYVIALYPVNRGIM